MRNKSNKKVIVPVVFMIGGMIAIFIFSAQDGTGSGRLSSLAARFFCKILFVNFDGMPGEQQAFLVSGINHFIRKAAHFLCYTFLGVCSYSVFHFTDYFISPFLPSVAVCAIYAVLDEIHQYFTPGRAMKITDMILDTIGAAFGAAVAMIAIIVIMHFKSNADRKKFRYGGRFLNGRK